MSERTTVRLPDDLMERAKAKAATEGRTLTALIEEGLRRILKERPPSAKAGRVSLPVSSAGGGLAPGIDLSDSTSLQEMDDLDAAGRLR